MSANAPLHVTLHYDFASSLCYVAHRVLGRLQGFLDEIEMEIEWTPVDLARLMRWQRGHTIDPGRVEHIRQIAGTLHVPLHMPRVWLDSRRVGAAAIVLADRDRLEATRREASWRERVFTRIFEEGRACDTPGELERMAVELGIELDASIIDTALAQLDAQTIAASKRMVTGVPTFMLGPWPFAGIQDDHTMRSILGRWAHQQRRELGDGPRV
jgi:predicted DsbA family dithiol-disulfide isomerase